ncbi:MAG TPA: DUF1501 domain-containing protein [Planctomycetota bacterium]|jgi:uncharacterized protein (DUF1501 family)|nr:DUF1501 domain-containing protein [Planctomycetota bacterium]
MLDRRSFLQQGASAAIGSPLAWCAAPRLLRALLGERALRSGSGSTENALVVLRLRGGNDGLNTVVPFEDDAYHRARPTLRAAAKGAIRIDDRLGLNPEMKALRPLLESGRLALVPTAGYPKPSRSHFRAMDVWESALPDREHVSTGWLGRALDASRDLSGGSLPAASLGDPELPLSLWGERGRAAAILSLETYRLAPRTGPGAAACRSLLAGLQGEARPEGTDLAFVAAAMRAAFASAESLERATTDAGGSAAYPATDLGRDLRAAARVLRAGFGTRLFHVSHSGFDTHAEQASAHPRLLRELAEAIAAFFADLDAQGLGGRVLLLAFSEFGRRVRENGSHGTDHGAAGPVFLVGPVKGGIHGPAPDLRDLEEGGVRLGVDFRSVYATVLERWLGWRAEPVLGARFEPVGVL